MADWNDIKNAFERDAEKKEARFRENEQTLLKSITTYLCKQKGVSLVQGYSTDEIKAFLQKPTSEIKTCLGGQWLTMPDDKMGILIYSLLQKVKKSGTLMPW